MFLTRIAVNNPVFTLMVMLATTLIGSFTYPRLALEEFPSVDFPAAWLSHYEPTPQKAPVVWGVMLFYKLMIPFMVGGLVLQIALHLWRVVVNR